MGERRNLKEIWGAGFLNRGWYVYGTNWLSNWLRCEQLEHLYVIWTNTWKRKELRDTCLIQANGNSVDRHHGRQEPSRPSGLFLGRLNLWLWIKRFFWSVIHPQPFILFSLTTKPFCSDGILDKVYINSLGQCPIDKITVTPSGM